MPRRRNLLPTTIYWLFDIRPETLIEYPRGRPFYCGKTVYDVEKRLKQHCYIARHNSSRPISHWLIACGVYVRAQTMEVVPTSEKWAERERFWIFTLRTLYPGGANVTSGGDGTAGNIQTPETRAKIGTSKIGKKRKPFSKEHLAALSASKKGRVVSAEHRAKISAAKTGRKRAPFSPEWRANLSAGQHRRHQRANASAL